MVWFYDRDEDSLRLETRYDNQTAEFVVTVDDPDGQTLKRFTDIKEFRHWLETFEFHLRLQHWSCRNGPLILPLGWPDKPLT